MPYQIQFHYIIAFIIGRSIINQPMSISVSNQMLYYYHHLNKNFIFSEAHDQCNVNLPLQREPIIHRKLQFKCCQFWVAEQLLPLLCYNKLLLWHTNPTTFQTSKAIKKQSEKVFLLSQANPKDTFQIYIVATCNRRFYITKNSEKKNQTFLSSKL